MCACREVGASGLRGSHLLMGLLGARFTPIPTCAQTSLTASQHRLKDPHAAGSPSFQGHIMVLIPSQPGVQSP